MGDFRVSRHAGRPLRHNAPHRSVYIRYHYIHELLFYGEERADPDAAGVPHGVTVHGVQREEEEDVERKATRCSLRTLHQFFPLQDTLT